jgi:UDP-N-acetylmuramate--alanine ligase
VAEADESDRSFLLLWPSIAVLTNIDREHMESYADFEDLQDAFAEFANKVPFYGAVVACADDRRLAPVLARVRRRLLTYGLDDPSANFTGAEVELGDFGGRCVVHRKMEGTSERLGVLRLSIPGRHNLQNAIAAIAVALLVGLSFAQAADALSTFGGVERRFERYGDPAGVAVVDDYAHHPTEIRAVLDAARVSLQRRLIVAFQPHRYTRTQQLMEEFGPALQQADEIVLTDIYPASEEPIPGVTVEALAEAVRRTSGRPVRVASRVEDVIPEVLRVAQAGDAVIMLGAGSIGTLARQLVEALRQREGTA